MIERWIRVVTGRARRVVAVALVVAAAAGTYSLGVFGSLDQGGFADPATDSARALAREQAVFGNNNVDLIAIYRSDRLTADRPAFRRQVEHVLAGIPEGTTTTVLTAWQTGDPAMISTDRHAVQVYISLAGADQSEQSDANDRVMPALESADLHTEIAGPWAVFKGVNEQVRADLARAEAISMPIVLVLSLLIFGSLVAAAMPVMVGLFAVLGALALVRTVSLFTGVSVFSVNVVTLLGMGLAIDYALFVVSRYREELGRLPEDDPDAPKQAVAVTLRTAGRTVLFSGLTVAGAMSALLIFPQDFLRSVGLGGIAAVLVGALTALTVLPAVLLLLGRRIDAGRMPWARRRGARVDDDRGAWARLARGVMRRPVVVMVVIVGALLVIAAPFANVTWGSVDHRVLPPTHPAHVASVTLAEDFGDARSTANLVVETTGKAEVAEYVDRVLAVPGVTDARVVDQKDGVTLVRAAWAGESQSGESMDLVRELRAVPGPGGAHVLVGGISADTADLLSSLRAHLPWMAGIIAAVMLVLLFLAFGSVILPVKAIAMNLLSISASFGVITWIFADGHLEGLLGFTSTGYLDATQPIFMLAILVGLSMDYEVFLLSRVRERWDATEGSGLGLSARNADAVAVGLQKTGRIITSAALLLAVVIGAFATSGIVFMKMIGVGMLVALLVDATIVRALLVPATMRLLGRWNWWAPPPLRRLWVRYGVREA